MTDAEMIATVRDKALETLKKLGGQYVYTDKYGTHTNVARKKRQRRADYSNLNIRAQIEQAMPGEVISFPVKGYTANGVQSAVTAMADRFLGKGNYQSTQDKKTESVTLAILGTRIPNELEAALAREARNSALNGRGGLQ